MHLKNTDALSMQMDESQVSRGCRLDERVWQGLEYLESVAGPGAVAEMIDHFGQDMPARIKRMRAALDDGDQVLLARLAHDLKSNGATLGVSAISALGASIERAAEGGTTEDVVSLIEEVEQLLPRTIVALEQRGSSFTS